MTRLLILAGVTGVLASCAPVPSEPGICAGLKRPVADLRGALVGHPETPEAVGNAGADVVIGFEAGCML